MKNLIVFYDGQCPLCQFVKKVTTRLDCHFQVNWVPVQAVRPATQAKAQSLTGTDMYEEIYVVTDNNRVAVGYQAIQEIVSVLPSIAWLTWLLNLSFVENLGQPLYRFISRHRHDWFGRLSYNEAFLN